VGHDAVGQSLRHSLCGRARKEAGTTWLLTPRRVREHGRELLILVASQAGDQLLVILSVYDELLIERAES
jgi:hypothetical protein